MYSSFIFNLPAPANDEGNVGLKLVRSYLPLRGHSMYKVTTTPVDILLIEANAVLNNRRKRLAQWALIIIWFHPLPHALDAVRLSMVLQAICTGAQLENSDLHGATFNVYGNTRSGSENASTR